MKLSKRLFSVALAISIACGTSVCVSAASSPKNDNALQSIKTVSQLLKDKAKKYSYQKGKLYLTEGDFTYLVHLSLKKGGSYAQLIAYSGSDTEITVPAYADRFPVTNIFSFGIKDEDYRNSIKTLNLPETVKSISGADVFDLFGLENINVSTENPYISSIDGVAFDYYGNTLLALPASRTSYEVPETVTMIGDFACYASSLESITFPEGLAWIGDYAFFSSPKLKEIKLPETTEYTGEYAFAHCVNLQKAVVSFEMGMTFDSTFEAAADNFVMLSADTVKKGEGITLYAAQRDSLAKYAFYYKKAGDKKWTTEQGFSDMSSAIIVPAHTGDYQICVKIKDSDGTLYKNYIDITVLP